MREYRDQHREWTEAERDDPRPRFATTATGPTAGASTRLLECQSSAVHPWASLTRS